MKLPVRLPWRRLHSNAGKQLSSVFLLYDRPHPESLASGCSRWHWRCRPGIGSTSLKYYRRRPMASSCRDTLCAGSHQRYVVEIYSTEGLLAWRHSSRPGLPGLHTKWRRWSWRVFCPPQPLRSRRLPMLSRARAQLIQHCCYSVCWPSSRPACAEVAGAIERQA